MTPPLPAHSLYALVPNTTTNSNSASMVVQFASDSTGAVNPVSTLFLPANLITLAMTTDSSGQIYVTGTQGTAASEILIYAAGSYGAGTPIRTISNLPFAGLATSMKVDSVGQIYISSTQGVVLVYAAGAAGIATPIRTIEWDPTKFIGGWDVAFDDAGYIYVSGYIRGTVGTLDNPCEIWVFAPGASGFSTPVRTIVGPNAPLTPNSTAMTVDSSGNIFALLYNPADPWLNATEIAEFAPGASGNATPIKTIIGGIGYGLGPVHLQIDGEDNIYVVGAFQNNNLVVPVVPPTQNSNVPPFIAVFPSTASGITVPAYQFTSTALNDGAFGLTIY